MRQTQIKSRAIAIFVKMQTGIEPTINTHSFDFDADAKGCIGGKSIGAWEREFAGTRDDMINQLNRSYGDEQRRLRKLKT